MSPITEKKKKTKLKESHLPGPIMMLSPRRPTSVPPSPSLAPEHATPDTKDRVASPGQTGARRVRGGPAHRSRRCGRPQGGRPISTEKTECTGGRGSGAFAGGDGSLGSPVVGSDVSNAKYLCLNWTHVFLRMVISLTPPATTSLRT